MTETTIPPQVGPDFMKNKRGQRSPNKKEVKEAQQQNKKREKKREGAMLLSFYHTCASK